MWEQHDETHVRPGRVQHIFINCSQFAMHDINTKAKRGYEAGAHKRHVQNYDAKDNRHKARDEASSTTCPVPCGFSKDMCVCVERVRLLRAGFYY